MSLTTLSVHICRKTLLLTGEFSTEEPVSPFRGIEFRKSWICTEKHIIKNADYNIRAQSRFLKASLLKKITWEVSKQNVYLHSIHPMWHIISILVHVHAISVCWIQNADSLLNSAPLNLYALIMEDAIARFYLIHLHQRISELQYCKNKHLIE